MTISETTEISSKRDRAAFPDIEVGQRVTSAVINPRTLVTAQLALGSPKSLRATGTIFHLDRQLFIVTVTPAVGEPLKLLVPNKPGIITLDGNPRANFGDLEEGDELQLAFYRPDGVVVKYGRHIPVGSPLLELLQIPYTEDRCAKGIKWEFSFV